MAGTRRRILFSAFEPSGDALAAPVISRLLERQRDLEIWALGGPRMRLAGARLLESTTGQPAMLLGAVSQVLAHRRRLRSLAGWLAEHDVSALVPVDSPAANWSICRLIRKTQPGAAIVHLAAPQLWAWAPWRIGKLRRLTDRVLCLLPFEPAWFDQRGVPAVFVGHPLFDPPPDNDASAEAADLPAEGQPKIALLPGSRPAEIAANLPTMVGAFLLLQGAHPRTCGVVAMTNDDAAASLQRVAGGRLDPKEWPGQLRVVAGHTEAVLAWADAAMVVSGTATLQCAARHTPMVVLYNTSRWAWHLWGRWLVRTRTFALPNLITATDTPHHAVPEFVPHFGPARPVANAMDRLVRDHHACRQQMAAFDAIASHYAGRSYRDGAAEQILGLLG